LMVNCSYFRVNARFVDYFCLQADSSDQESEDDDPEETWLTPILVEAGIPDNMMNHAEEMLVRQEGIGSEKTLAHLSPTLFHRDYLEDLDIRGLGLQQVLLDLHDDLHKEFLKKRRADNLRDMRAQQQAALPPLTRAIGQAAATSGNALVRKASTMPLIFQRSPAPATVRTSTAVRVPASFNGPKTDLQILYNTAPAPLVEKASEQPSHIATLTATAATPANMATDTTAVRASLIVETTKPGKKRSHTTVAEEDHVSEDSVSKRTTLPSPVHPVVRYTLEDFGRKCQPTVHAPAASGTPPVVKVETVATRAVDSEDAKTAEKKAIEKKVIEKKATESAVLDSDSGSDCCSDAEYVVAKDFPGDDGKMIASG